MGRARLLGAAAAAASLVAAACAGVFGVADGQNGNLLACDGRTPPLDLDPDASDGGCIECAEDRCCAPLGGCTNAKSCPQALHDHLGCVLPKAGALRSVAEAEKACGALADPALGAYTCLRDKCGDHCGLPNCSIVSSAPQLGALGCDQCLTRDACLEINRCQEDRGCRLFLACVAANPGCLATVTAARAVGACDAGATTAPDPAACVRTCLESTGASYCGTLELLGRLGSGKCSACQLDAGPGDAGPADAGGG